MHGRKDDKEVGNVGNKHESVGSEWETENGIYENSEPETGHGNGELNENDKVE